MTERGNRVFITGMGACSALGTGVEEMWRGLVDGRSGVRTLAAPDLQGLRVSFGGTAVGFDPATVLDSRDLKRTSRASQLALVAATQALRHAAVLDADLDRAEVPVIIGSAVAGFVASDGCFRDFYLHGKSAPLVIPVSMNIGPSSWVSMKFGFGGGVLNIDAACASGAHSIAYAWSSIRNGSCELAVAGGADTPFSRGVMDAWSVMRVLSTRNAEPESACRPFSADRDGLVLGEGAGILVVESERSVRRRKVEPLAEIIGYGMSADAYHLTQPSFEGPSRAIGRALASAGLQPEDVDAINAHGTGTKSGDANETKAIKHRFGARARQLPIVANKAGLGHTLAATGAIEAISCVMSLRDQVLPQTINFRERDPDCDLDYVTEASRPQALGTILSNSFAFGGSNAVLILRRAGL